jgi:hypothetical protein
MEWPLQHAVGALALLWHESQAAGRATGSAEDIANWSWHDEIAVAKRLLLALKAVGYISEVGENTYCIHGNEKVLERLEKYATNASKGGKAGAGIRKNKVKATANQPLSDRLANEKLLQYSTEQYNNTNTPLSPPCSGGVKKSRTKRLENRDAATRYASLAIGARREGLDQEAAAKRVGTLGWRLLLDKFGSWDSFANAYAIATTVKRHGGSDATIFEAQLKESFRVLLTEPVQSRAEDNSA